MNEKYNKMLTKINFSQVTELLKVAKTNLIVVKLLASGHTKNSTVPPEFDFSSHMHFPIIKVK